MSFSSQVSSSTQTMTGAINTIKFFLSEAFLGQQFEAVDMEANKPEPGDLFLYKLLNPVGHWCGAHVGVYCGHGEIIHFEGKRPSRSGLHQFLGSWEGVVCKQGQRALQRSRQLWRVLRRRGGVDHAGLERRVREAMTMDPPTYHPTRYNCVHFALSLLGLDRSSGLEVVDLDPTMD
uniref:LRAT domain-containing protein n=1 Tax=Cavia porcellus TaxID=10141 RepID=A0A286XR71_CAVPO